MFKFVSSLLLAAAISSAFANSGIPAPTSALTPPSSSVQPIDQIVATVNDDVITKSELDAAIANTKKQAEAMHANLPKGKALRELILNQIIYRKLQLQLAKRNGMTVSAEQLNTTISAIAKRNGISVAELKAKLNAEGFTLKHFRQQIREQLLISQIQRAAIGPTIKISDNEISEFINHYQKSTASKNKQYHIIDILIPNKTSAGYQQAKKISAKLNSGSKIADITDNTITSNDMGWVGDNDLPNIFLVKIKHMRTGKVSAPIKAANGYHILQLLEVRQGSGKSLSRDKARQILFQQKFQKALKTWVEKLKSEAAIKLFPATNG